MRTTTCRVAIATTLLSLALAAPLGGQVALHPDDAAPRHPAAAERFNLGLRGVYFVENQGQWSDESVYYGLKSRGLDVAFRESSFTMHLARDVSGDVPVAVARGAWASRPYESELVERASRPYESELVEWASRPFDLPIAPEASPTRERGFSTPDHPDPLPDGRGSLHAPVEHEHLTLTITFPGSNPVTPRGAQPQTAKFNYFVGGEGRVTASNVPSFGAVIYENLYDGIDLFVCGNDDGVMKYEFHCAPGADYSQIRIHYDGIDTLCVNDEGDLEIATSFGTLLDGAPIVWQEDINSLPRLGGGGLGRGSSDASAESDIAAAHDSNDPHPDPPPQSRGREPGRSPTIPARFELIDDHTYRIALDAAPDSSLPLVIDPEIEWMIYLGGSELEEGLSTCISSAGSVLVSGVTFSGDFEGRNNSYYRNMDAFALAAAPSGELLWMTYLGGFGNDIAEAIAVDRADNLLVTGWTRSNDFAGRTNSYYGGWSDAFAVSLNPDGYVQWMTYLGGREEDKGYGIAVDSVDNLLVTGGTKSPDFAGRGNSFSGPYWDAYVVKIGPDGNLRWMTYIGASDGIFEMALAIAVDGSDAALLAGLTDAMDFPGRTNSYHGGPEDGFVALVTADGVPGWMTYLGGSDYDRGAAIAVDAAGSAFISGETRSIDFEGRNNVYHGGFGEYASDAFVAKVDPGGRIPWMMYLGGTVNEYGRGIVVDDAGHAMMTGWTDSIDFKGQVNSHHGGEFDAYLAMVDTTGFLSGVLYVGGSGWDFGRGVALDGSGRVFLTGSTSSPDVVGRLNEYHARRDAFIVTLRLADGPQLTVAPTCPSGGPIRIEWSGATPGGQAALIYARNTGSFLIPNNRPCAGTQLGLDSNQIQLAWQGGAGQSGSRTLNTTAGPGACGGHLQLLDLTTCATSNVARIE